MTGKAASVVLVACAFFLAACGGPETPVEAAEAFVAAFQAGDGRAVEDLACEQHAAGLRREAESLKDEGDVAFELEYRLVSEEADRAVVHFQGRAKVTDHDGLVVEIEEMDQDIRMVREQGAWKFCSR